MAWVAAALLAGCAMGPTPGEAPEDAERGVTMRHVSGPQAAGAWLDAANLPSDAQRTDGTRAVLLEVSLPEDGSVLTEIAPLELANFVLRIDERDRRQVVVGIDNATAERLAFDLYASPDGRRFRRIPACPVEARGRGFARWPERTREVAVAGVRRATESDAACR